MKNYLEVLKIIPSFAATNLQITLYYARSIQIFLDFRSSFIAENMSQFTFMWKVMTELLNSNGMEENSYLQRGKASKQMTSRK